MSYIVDTDLLSLFGRKNVPEKLSQWADENQGFYISAVTLAEQEFGLEEAPESHRDELRDFLQEIRVSFSENTLPISVPVLVRWKQLIAELKKKKRTMSCEDSLIAATALHLGYTVVTRNVRHFEPAGVECVNPLSA